MCPVKEKDQSLRPPKRFYHRSNRPTLKALSTNQIWTLLEDIKSSLEKALFLTNKQIRGLKRRQRDLEIELNDRIREDERLCKLYGPIYRDGEIQEFEGTIRDPILLDRDIEACRKANQSPARKALCRVANTQYNGFLKPKHIPNPKNKIRMDRSKIRKQG